MSHKPAICVAMLMAVVVIVTAFCAPAGLEMTSLVSNPSHIASFGVWTIASLPLAFAMPLFTRAIFMQSSYEYILPRWSLPLLLGAIVGQIIGCAVLAILLRDVRYLWFVVSFTIICIGFGAGVRRRLTKPA